jgi:hypothetical protein
MITLQYNNGKEWINVDEWNHESLAWASLGGDNLNYRTIDEKGKVLTDKSKTSMSKKLISTSKKIIILLLFSFVAKGQDTIYVKNVIIGKDTVKVESGYIIKINRRVYRINGRNKMLKRYKFTNDSKFKYE